MRNNQFNSLVPFVKIVDDMFSKTFHDYSGGQLFRNDIPAVNVLENENEVRLEIAAPGLEKSDFKISVESNHLVISSDKKEESIEQQEKYTRKEFSFHSFKRMYLLPENTNATSISAKYDNGILSISIPKVVASSKNVKSIDIE